MAVRQYVGARYVPKFFENPDGTNEWITGIPYEALTIVTYADIQFISKKPVPSSIGSPNENQEYWIVSGNTGGGVSQDILDQINKNTTDISTNTVDIAKLKEDVKKEKGYTAIYVGNSYAKGVGSVSNKGIYELTKDYFIKSYVFYGSSGKGGEGFAPYTGHSETYYEILKNNVDNMSEEDKNEVTHVLFICAMGDSRYKAENKDILTNSFEQYIRRVSQYISANLPNAKGYIYFAETISTNNTPGASCTFQDSLWSDFVYTLYANMYNMCYLGWGGWQTTLLPEYLSNDGYHPNDAGYAVLVNNLLLALKGQYVVPVRTQQKVSKLGGNVIVVGTPKIMRIIMPVLTSNLNITSGNTVLIDSSDNLIVPYQGPALNGAIRDTNNGVHYGGISTSNNGITLSTNQDFEMPRQNYYLSPTTIQVFFY